VFYLDPRLVPACLPLDPAEITHADLVLASHDHACHLHGPTLSALLEASPRAKLVLPKSAVERARAIGIDYQRMTPTDSGLRVEYFRDGDYIRVYAVPSAHDCLDWTPATGFPYLGYLLRCGSFTLYHAGDGVPYDSLADRLRPYDVTVAMLPIAGERNFRVSQAADLAQSIGARWLVPMHYEAGDDSLSRFVDHLLFHRPEQRFKVFGVGEGWAVPED
jgi:L-ascorbate metabolism protein UlaG (beta-lactamase superfamily)